MSSQRDARETSFAPSADEEAAAEVARAADGGQRAAGEAPRDGTEGAGARHGDSEVGTEGGGESASAGGPEGSAGAVGDLEPAGVAAVSDRFSDAVPGGEAAVASGELSDDEMDAFFPSVARAAARGQAIASLLDEELLVKALAERDEYLDALRRLQADFENFRKRTERQLADVRSRASEALLERLLPVLDALDLALAHLAPRSGPEPASEGGEARGGEDAERAGGDAYGALSQVGTLLRDTLSKEGLERIDAVGVEFDPTVHDAVAHAEGEGDGAVVDEVMRAGYLLKGRVLRPAMVKVRG